ncbi:ABC transporter ATP-binding protein [Oceanobacillus indicireducens]|uniref:ABC transporter ATP-binding protein YjkB n=1 Tax=Oceanobacillus indicireducens TaxID=1004261 RepID=A0A917XVT9_9BACI|nr:phosphate ABC transporter ATP-binding protein [Oceanobacillus indicireducens]GGN55848.1 putative ABC transporter ATP-binding protein YjkB [Oceanobacillus indicireducens]
MNTEYAIELENVSYSDGPLKIIKNVSGSFRKGKITSLVGPSGAGKTTLFRLCNGLISPTHGTISIYSKNIQEYEPTKLRRNVGLALQNATMLQGTVYKNLQLPRSLAGETLTEDEAADLLTKVSLDKDLLKRNVGDLSGGQRQKVSIARTLVNQPEILLLDEITSSLDRVSTNDIENLIEKINKENGVTIIWITHNLNQATQIGDDTWVMMNGELIESGPSSLLKNPENEKVKQFAKGDFI